MQNSPDLLHSLFLLFIPAPSRRGSSGCNNVYIRRPDGNAEGFGMQRVPGDAVVAVPVNAITQSVNEQLSAKNTSRFTSFARRAAC